MPFDRVVGVFHNGGTVTPKFCCFFFTNTAIVHKFCLLFINTVYCSQILLIVRFSFRLLEFFLNFLLLFTVSVFHIDHFYLL